MHREGLWDLKESRCSVAIDTNIATVCMVNWVPSSPSEILVPHLNRFFTFASFDPSAKLTPYGCEDPRECGAVGGTRSTLTFAGRTEGLAALQEVLRETTAIRQLLEKREDFRDVAREWLQVGYVLDVLLFRVYLAAVLAYSITLGTLWSVWRDA